MLKTLQSIFESRTPGTAEPSAGRALLVASAVLLIEVSQADAKVTEAEQATVRAVVQERFQLTPDETEELLALAEQQVNAATSLYQFTSLIDKSFSPEEKRRMVELLWEVAFADGEMEENEEYLVRKVAGLIHVPHKAFIDTKLAVKARRTGDR